MSILDHLFSVPMWFFYGMGLPILIILVTW